jgi:hypothetical protein
VLLRNGKLLGGGGDRQRRHRHAARGGREARLSDPGACGVPAAVRASAAPEPGALRGVLVHAFQGYAEVFWPIFAPLAALLIEPERHRKILIAGCLVIGIALSAYLLAMMLAHPYEASAGSGHIVYMNGNHYPTGIEAPYVVATTISLLLSSHKHVQRLALVILIGFAVAYVSFHHAYISVWCFFAAIASVMVYLYVRAVSARSALQAVV